MEAIQGESHMVAPPSSGARLRRHLAAAAIHLILTGVMTWPMILHLGSKIPLVPKWTLLVPYHGLYIIAWTHHALDTGLSRYWDANIFYPHPRVMTYSENILSPVVSTWPVHRLSHNITLSYNLIILGAFFLTALGTYLWVSQLGLARGVSVVAGGAMAFCPYMIAESYCLVTLFIYPVPFLMASLHRLIDRPTWVRAVLAGLCGIWLLTSSYQYALFAIVFCALWFLWFCRRIPWGRLWYKLLVVGAVCLGLVVPLFVTIKRNHRDMGFYHGPTLPMTWPQLLVPGVQQRLYYNGFGITFRDRRDDVGPVVCFPGITFGLLAGIGGVTALFRKTAGPAERRTRYVYRFYLAAALLALLFSLGLWIRVGPLKIPGPYGLLFLTLPAFNSVRSVYRFYVFAQLFATVLMALGLERCLRAIASAGWRATVAAAAVLLIAVEYVGIPLDMQKVGGTPDDVHPLYKRLAEINPKAPLIELPVPTTVRRTPLDALYMFNSVHTWQPLVNGYASYWPGLYEELRPVLEDFPTVMGLRHLTALGVQYVLVHEMWMPPRSLEALKETEALKEVARDGQDVLYALKDSQRRYLDEWEGETRFRIFPDEKDPRKALGVLAFDLDVRDVLPVLPGDRATKWRLEWRNASGRMVHSETVAVRNSHWLSYRRNELREIINLPQAAGLYDVVAIDVKTGRSLGACRQYRVP